MDILIGFLNFVKYTVILIMVILLFILLFDVVKVGIIYRKKLKKIHKHHSKKFVNRHYLYCLLYQKSMKIIKFVKWVSYDLITGKDYLKLFGIWAFTGYYGEGKTLGAITYATMLKQKYSDIKLFSNFNLRGQDGSFNNPQELVDIISKIKGRKIILFDELQNTFNTTNFSKFPIEILAELTQCRKNQVAVFASTPIFQRMSFQIKDSCDKVVECKNLMGLDRWFTYTFYRKDDYELYCDEDTKKLKKYRLYKQSYVMTNRNYRKYDTKAKVKRFELLTENEVKSRQMTDNIKRKLNDDYKKIKKEIAMGTL